MSEPNENLSNFPPFPYCLHTSHVIQCEYIIYFLCQVVFVGDSQIKMSISSFGASRKQAQ